MTLTKILLLLITMAGLLGWRLQHLGYFKGLSDLDKFIDARTWEIRLPGSHSNYRRKGKND